MHAALAQADWVNLSGAEVAPNIAEIYVEDDGVNANFFIQQTSPPTLRRLETMIRIDR
jgi:hypothetical protein